MTSSEAVYRSRSIKRRTKQQLASILDATKAVIDEEVQITIRHGFYRMVGFELLEKIEREYHHIVNYYTTWRRAGLIPYTAFADNTRRYYGSTTYSNMVSMLIRSRDFYRRNIWESQNKLVEIWTEKDAMATILSNAVDPWGVRVFSVRGFSSLTAVHTAAESFKRYLDAGYEVHVYYFGDHDPSGLSIEKNIIKSLREDHDVEIDFRRVAVLPDQIRQYNLPTRPTKKTDTRARGFEGEAVDIDAMNMNVVRALAENCVIQHIDPDELQRTKLIEEREKETLDTILQVYQEVVEG